MMTETNETSKQTAPEESSAAADTTETASETAAADTAENAAPETEEERQLHEDYRRFGIEGADEESMDSIADVLSTFQSDETDEAAAKKEKAGKKSDLAKKKRVIPILAAVAVVGLILYIWVLKPMLAEIAGEKEIPPINTWLTQQMESGAITEAKYTQLLNDGKCEVLGSQNRILMFNHIEKANIQSVEVHNEHGTYTFYRDASDNFVIKDAETASYDKELLSSLVVSSGYTLSMTRVSEICEDMSEYGLGKSDNPSYYTLTTTSGVSHTVYIGSPIPTGAGYYCSYEDRPAVYVLDSTLASTLLADVKDLMTAIIAYPVSSTYYFTITNFEMTKHGEPFLKVDYLSDAERIQTASTSVWRMTYPEGGYTPSSTNYDGMLQTFSSFIGLRVLEYNVLGSGEDAEPTEEQIAVLERYGLAQPDTTVSFDYTDPDQGFTVTNNVWFSAITENGTYYVYSWLFDLISEIDAASYPWISYDIIDFIDAPVFQMNINNVSRVEIFSGPDDTETKVNGSFRLEGEGQALVVTEDNLNKVLDTQNFRQVYKTMLSIEIGGYSEDVSADPSKLLGSMRITTGAGFVTEYRFYTTETRKCFMTVNGEGEFYVMRDMVRKLLSDAQKVIDGVSVSSDARS